MPRYALHFDFMTAQLFRKYTSEASISFAEEDASGWDDASLTNIFRNTPGDLLNLKKARCFVFT